MCWVLESPKIASEATQLVLPVSWSFEGNLELLVLRFYPLPNWITILEMYYSTVGTEDTFTEENHVKGVILKDSFI